MKSHRGTEESSVNLAQRFRAGESVQPGSSCVNVVPCVWKNNPRTGLGIGHLAHGGIFRGLALPAILKGWTSFSPGLLGTSYPGSAAHPALNSEGVASSRAGESHHTRPTYQGGIVRHDPTLSELGWLGLITQRSRRRGNAGLYDIHPFGMNEVRFVWIIRPIGMATLPFSQCGLQVS